MLFINQWLAAAQTEPAKQAAEFQTHSSHFNHLPLETLF